MRREGIVWGIVLSLAGAGAAVAAEPDLPGLVALRGRYVEVRYSPGALDRAARAQARFEQIAALVVDLHHRPVGIALWVVEPEDWSRSGFTRPFGFPERLGDWGVAVPAWGDHHSVDLWRGLLGGELPAPSQSFVRGTPEEMASTEMGDLMANLEAVRLLFASCGYAAEPAWAHEVAVHAAARLAFLQYVPERLAEIDEIFARFASRYGGDGARPLAAWDPAGPLRDKLWFEGQFARGAALLIDGAGPARVRRLLTKGLAKGKVADGEELEKRAPALGEWHLLGFDLHLGPR